MFNKLENFTIIPTTKFRDSFRDLHPVFERKTPAGAYNHRCTFCAVDYIGYQTVRLDMRNLKRLWKKWDGVKSAMYAAKASLFYSNMAEIVNYAKSVGMIILSQLMGSILKRSF